jgi:hypothetical protein
MMLSLLIPPFHVARSITVVACTQSPTDRCVLKGRDRLEDAYMQRIKAAKEALKISQESKQIMICMHIQIAFKFAFEKEEREKERVSR